MQTEKKYVKVIDDDIYNRIIECKAKNEIIKINRNCNNDQKIWRGKYGHEHQLMTKIALDV